MWLIESFVIQDLMLYIFINLQHVSVTEVNEDQAADVVPLNE